MWRAWEERPHLYQSLVLNHQDGVLNKYKPLQTSTHFPCGKLFALIESIYKSINH